MINEKLLQQAIQVLRDVNKKHYGDSSKKKPLFEDEKDTTLYLQFSLKKIPKYKSVQMIKINLPNSLLKDNSEVCLITGDLDKKNHKAEIEPDVLHYKEILKKHEIDQISEVLTLRQLRTEYKPYEAKQKLLAAYDVFLADRKIAECLPKVLGRHFFKKRKFPLQITMNTPNLKQQVEKALSTKVFYLTGHGNCCNSEVAYLDMSDAKISENVIAMVKAVCDKLPGSWTNVMGVYLKTSLSKAIPVYMSYDDPSKVHLEEEKVDVSYEMDELSTCPDSLVKVYRDGRVKTVHIKRMAETEIDETTDVSRNLENKKKNKENIINDSIDNLSNTDFKESSKVKRKSKSKKTNDEGILELETDKSICSIEEKEEMKNANVISKKKKGKKSFSTDEDYKTIACTNLKGKSFENTKKSKNDRSELMNEVSENAASSNLKGKSNEMGKKQKNNRKSIRNMLKRDPEEFLNSTSLKEMPEVIRKSKNKTKRMESISSDTNTSITCSPIQAEKKKKAREILRKTHSVKRISKGRQDKGNHL